MFNPGFYDTDDPMAAMGMFQHGMTRAGGPPKRFDEYYRCYPVAMLPGPERENVNHGGKVIMPPSALDKLTRLHITYPMLFELINGAQERMTHAGVLEFIAEEGKIYLPYWMLQTLALDPGDLVQIKSTDLPSGNFIKLRPQSSTFLDISDPKAVLENAFRNFACLTIGDIFTFAYNDSVYEIEVLETKPSLAAKGAIGVLETDLEVDFAAPVGYEEPKRSGTSTPAQAGTTTGGVVHTQGSMAQAINYASIAPTSSIATSETRDVSSNFSTGGHKLKASSKTLATKSTAIPAAPTLLSAKTTTRRANGPQPLRLPPGKLFFGYEVKPVRKTDGVTVAATADKTNKPQFQGQGQTLRAGGKRKEPEKESSSTQLKAAAGSTAGKGRTLKDISSSSKK